jgi:hypothetical protein
MRANNMVANMAQIKNIKTFADFQVWIKGIKNNTGEFEYVQLTQTDFLRQDILLETVLRLKSKQHDIEIKPVFPESFMDLISQSIANADAKTFIPIVGIKMVCKSMSSWSRNRNLIKHDIVEVDLMKRDPEPFELDFMKIELSSILEDISSAYKKQLR